MIGADGKLVGYAGGLERKQRLLILEGALPDTPTLWRWLLFGDQMARFLDLTTRTAIRAGNKSRRRPSQTCARTTTRASQTTHSYGS